MTEQIASLVDPLVPVLKAFELIGVRMTKGYELVNDGRLKAIRSGRMRYVRASEIRRFIDDLAAASEKRAA